MKNIYQLQKIAKRIVRRSSGAMAKLLKKHPPADKIVKPWKGEPNVHPERARQVIVGCAAARVQLKKELEARRIGLPPARPPRVKHAPLTPIDVPALCEQVKEVVATFSANPS